MKKKLIVMSADAMVYEDLTYFKTLPGYQKYLKGGAEIKHMKSIFPTVTYPCHTTMSTGTYPAKHGVLTNMWPTNFLDRPCQNGGLWNRFYNNVKVKEDIFTAAKAAGYTTAAVFWPVTGNHPSIDYLINEIFPEKEDETVLDAFARSGSSKEMLEIAHKNLCFLKEIKHPYIDVFCIKCACDIIKEYKPDILFLHPSNIDHYRHAKGLFGEHVNKGIVETDGWITELMETAEIAGIADDVNFVLVSDHGQLNSRRFVNLNIILADRGYITLKNGEVTDWRVQFVSTGMSAMVYLKDKNDKKLYNEIYDLLKFIRDEGIYGISQVFTAEEIEAQEHFAADFSFVVEGDDYTAFGDSAVRPFISNFDSSDYRTGAATHGYLPHKGPQPIFVAKGPDFKENVSLENGCIVDEAPTFAKILGVSLPLADGKSIDEILK